MGRAVGGAVGGVRHKIGSKGELRAAGGEGQTVQGIGCRSHMNPVVVVTGNLILSNLFSEGSSNGLVVFRFNMCE